MRRTYAYGVLLVLVGGVCLSLAGILIRNIESASGWQILFYRANTFFVTVLFFIVLRYRSRTVEAFRAVGGRGLWVAVVLGLGSVAYVFALLLTTVANVTFIIGASPLVTAVAAWLFLKERLTTGGVVAMMAALGGIALMFADGIIAGRWFGNLMAVLVVLSFSAMLVIIRGQRETDMLPATCLAGLVAASIAGFMAEDLDISRHDLIICLLLGSVQFAGGFMLITIATRYIPAAEVALFSLTEAILGPLWVWIGVNEVPSGLTIAGSLVVLAAVSAYCIASIRKREGFVD